MTDIDFPEMPPAILDHEGEFREKPNLQTASLYPLEIKATAQQVTESDFDAYKLETLEKKVLVNELSDCGLYLKNIHEGFKHIGSTNSLIKLVMAGIGVHKHRRQVLKELKAVKSNKQIELDENGEIVQS